jgi:hypothetical protein
MQSFGVLPFGHRFCPFANAVTFVSFSRTNAVLPSAAQAKPPCALYYINPSRGWLAALSDRKCDAADAKAALRYLLAFVTGGLDAVAKAEPRARSTYQSKSRSNKRPR